MSGDYESISTVIDPEVTEETRTRRIPPYNVVVLNDEDHTFEYVIEMLIKLFAHTIPRAKDLTWEIHSQGRAIVYTTHKEKAELKREQVLAYGADPRLGRSNGPLRCYIEPAVSELGEDLPPRFISLGRAGLAQAQGGRQTRRDIGVKQVDAQSGTHAAVGDLAVRGLLDGSDTTHGQRLIPRWRSVEQAGRQVVILTALHGSIITDKVKGIRSCRPERGDGCLRRHRRCGPGSGTRPDHPGSVRPAGAETRRITRPGP